MHASSGMILLCAIAVFVAALIVAAVVGYLLLRRKRVIEIYEPRWHPPFGVAVE